MKKKTNWAKTKRYLPLYLMLLPGAAYLIINNYLPMAGLVLAFKKVNYNVGLFQSPWTGLSNFKYLFTTKDAFIFFRNTILYNLAFIFFGNLMGIITAVALDKEVLDRIGDLMKKQTDKTLEFVYEIDPSIIGGFILRVDSMQLDASVNSELKKLRLKLLNSK